jgi:hypothetical protein
MPLTEEQLENFKRAAKNLPSLSLNTKSVIVTEIVGLDKAKTDPWATIATTIADNEFIGLMIRELQSIKNDKLMTRFLKQIKDRSLNDNDDALFTQLIRILAASSKNWVDKERIAISTNQFDELKNKAAESYRNSNWFGVFHVLDAFVDSMMESTGKETIKSSIKKYKHQYNLIQESKLDNDVKPHEIAELWKTISNDLTNWRALSPFTDNPKAQKSDSIKPNSFLSSPDPQSMENKKLERTRRKTRTGTIPDYEKIPSLFAGICSSLEIQSYVIKIPLGRDYLLLACATNTHVLNDAKPIELVGSDFHFFSAIVTNYPSSERGIGPLEAISTTFNLDEKLLWTRESTNSKKHVFFIHKHNPITTDFHSQIKTKNEFSNSRASITAHPDNYPETTMRISIE